MNLRAVFRDVFKDNWKSFSLNVGNKMSIMVISRFCTFKDFDEYSDGTNGGKGMRTPISNLHDSYQFIKFVSTQNLKTM